MISLKHPFETKFWSETFEQLYEYFAESAVLFQYTSLICLNSGQFKLISEEGGGYKSIVENTGYNLKPEDQWSCKRSPDILAQ